MQPIVHERHLLRVSVVTGDKLLHALIQAFLRGDKSGDNSKEQTRNKMWTPGPIPLLDPLLWTLPAHYHPLRYYCPTKTNITRQEKTHSDKGGRGTTNPCMKISVAGARDCAA